MMNNDNTIPLPSDIQARIENAKNYVTEMDAENVRLTKLCNEITATINTKHSEKKDLEAKLASLKDSINEASDDIVGLKESIQIHTEARNKVIDEEQKAEDSLESLKAQIEVKRGELDARESAIDTHEVLIETRLKALEEAEKVHNDKVKKLQAAIS